MGASIILVVIALVLYHIAGMCFEYLHRKRERKLYIVLSYILLFSALISAGVFVAGILFFVFNTDLCWTLMGSVVGAIFVAWDLARIARRARQRPR
jgi:hypothetical protein